MEHLVIIGGMVTFFAFIRLLWDVVKLENRVKRLEEKSK